MERQFRRFHKNVFMPKFNLEKYWGRITEIKLAYHFLDRMERNSRFKGFHIPTVEELSKGEVFEVYFAYYGIDRLCVRLKGERSDFCYVISRNGHLITAWATGKKNTYDNIDYSIYETEEQYHERSKTVYPYTNHYHPVGKRV